MQPWAGSWPINWGCFNMSKFKIGDRVKSVASMSFTEGSVGVIVGVREGRYYPYEVNFNPENLEQYDDDGSEWFMDEDELIKVEDN